MPNRAYSRYALAALVSLSCLAQQSTARADAGAADKAAAEALFDRGLALMREGHYAEACAKLEQSQSIEGGIGTMLYLADCYEKLGRTASAWAMFREAASAARARGETERAAAGTERAVKLEPRLAKLTVHVAPENAVAGFELLRDGLRLANGLWGVALPVDPGQHKLEAQAPGRVPWTATVAVADAASVSLVVPPLAVAPVAASTAEPPPSPLAASAPPPAVVAHDSQRDGARDSAMQQTVGLIVAGAGVVALGVGTYFGIRASSKNGDAEDAGCAGAVCGQAQGLELTQQAQDAATLANIFVIGGVALAAAGVVVYLTAPDQEEAPAVSLGTDGRSAQLSLGGSF